MSTQPQTTAARPGRPTIQVHDSYHQHPPIEVHDNRIDATLALADGRSVQVGLLDDGRVILRAWSAEPYATDNAEAVAVSFMLPTLESAVLDGATVSDVNLRIATLTPRHLTSPEDHNGCWHLASQAVRDRVQAVRTLLALRHTST